MRPALEVENLVVTVGGRAVLRNLTFDAPVGQITGVFGPTGSGKSTLLRCLVGAQQISSGEVRVLGMPAGAAPLRRRVGYLTQAAIYPELSARQNVRYFAAVYGVSPAAADRVLADLELADSAGLLVASLSDDQRARVCLACALVAVPEVLVLDEPTAGLDPVRKSELWAHFRSLAARGTTLLIGGQALAESGRCDRLLLIREGRLLADDTPACLLRSTGAADAEAAYVRLCEPAATREPAPSAGARASLVEATR